MVFKPECPKWVAVKWCPVAMPSISTILKMNAWQCMWSALLIVFLNPNLNLLFYSRRPFFYILTQRRRKGGDNPVAIRPFISTPSFTFKTESVVKKSI